MRRLSSWIKSNSRRRSRQELGRGVALLAGLAWLAPLLAGAASFTATLDRENVTVGESATLTLRFEGGNPKSIPFPSDIPHL